MKTIANNLIILLTLILLISCGSDDDAAEVPQPGNPMLIAPENGASDLDPYDITLEWNRPANTDNLEIRYTIWVSTGPGVLVQPLASDLEDTTYTLYWPLEFDQTISWRVDAEDENGNVLQSETFTFTTRAQTAEESHLEGLWLGSYGLGDFGIGFGYAILFRSNGTMRTFVSNTPINEAGDTTNVAAGDIAEGEYRVIGTMLTGSYYFDEMNFNSIEADINTNSEMLTGTWGEGDNTSGGGQFILEIPQELAQQAVSAHNN